MQRKPTPNCSSVARKALPTERGCPQPQHARQTNTDRFSGVPLLSEALRLGTAALRLGCFAVLLIAFLAGFKTAAASLIVGPNLNITKSSANNAETTIAINPLNPNNLFADDTWAVMGR